jgi:hypothetical protein
MDTKNELLEMADLFIENEKLLSDFYALCLEKIPAHKEYWENLNKAEIVHTRIFEEIRADIVKTPENWSMGKIYPQALKVSIENLKSRMKEFQEGKANTRFILNFLMDVEQSLIESDLRKAFLPLNHDFEKKMEQLQTETFGHKNLLKTIIAKG